jgi:hypothetical protein
MCAGVGVRFYRLLSILSVTLLEPWMRMRCEGMQPWMVLQRGMETRGALSNTR